MGMFLKMFSSDKSSSYGRFASFTTLVCLLVWGSMIVVDTGKIPELPIAWFALVASMFGITKVGDVVVKRTEEAKSELQI